MATPPTSAILTIRDLDGAVEARLRARAARNGRSVEAEARSILSETLAPDSGNEPDLAEAIRRRVAPLGGVDLQPHPAVPIDDPTRLGG